jgi:hypothetical protein
MSEAASGRSGETFQVCAYDSSGRWAPAYPPVPFLVDEEGWMGFEGSVLAACAAFFADSPRVVVQDREHSVVMLIESGVIRYPAAMGAAVEALEGGIRALVAKLMAKQELLVSQRDSQRCRQQSAEGRVDFLHRVFEGGRYDLTPRAGTPREIDVVRFIAEQNIDTAEAVLFAKMRQGEAMELAGRQGRTRRMVLTCREAPRALDLDRVDHEKGMSLWP